MPEVATPVMAAIHKERGIAIGNVVGSNIFNIFGCLGLAGVVSATGLALAPSALNFDLWVMLAVAFACLPVFLTGRTIAAGRARCSSSTTSPTWPISSSRSGTRRAGRLQRCDAGLCGSDHRGDTSRGVAAPVRKA
jgi:hypothetical protein